MFHPTSLATLLTLGLLVTRVVTAPAPAPRGSSSVSFLLISFASNTILSVWKISWGGCDSFGVNSTDPNLQCGYLEVPMDYHDSSAGNARLAVIKYVATASKKLGTVFFNPGEPIAPSFALSPLILNLSRWAWRFGGRCHSRNWTIF